MSLRQTLLLLFAAFATSLTAQDAPKVLNIYRGGSVTTSVPLAEIDSITITESVQTDEPTIIISEEPLIASEESFMRFVAAYAEALASAVSTEYALEQDYLASPSALSSSDRNVTQAWSSFFQAVSRLNFLTKNAPNDAYIPMLKVHHALTYLKLTSHWGDVPYKTAETITQLEMPSSSEVNILIQMLSELNDAYAQADEHRNIPQASIGDFFYVSRDVVRLAMAEALAQLGQYAEARALLREIVDNGFYHLEAGEPSYAYNAEAIFGLTAADDSFVPFLDYKDALLLLAECEHHVGQDDTALTLIAEIGASKGVTIADAEPLSMIAEMRLKLKVPGTLAFLRRNNLGAAIGLDAASVYQLLWPIPESEIASNPLIMQNPGY